MYINHKINSETSIFFVIWLCYIAHFPGTTNSKEGYIYRGFHQPLEEQFVVVSENHDQALS